MHSAYACDLQEINLARDRLLVVWQVLDTCLAADIPVAGYVGGGYSPDLDVLARRHTLLHRAASEMWDSYELGSRESMPE